MSNEKKSRDSFFDNYKAFLILCVVIGHFSDHFTNDFRLAEILRIYIYFFHIPAFSFISGYFARKNNFGALIEKLLVPYLVFQVIYYIMYTGVGRDVDFALFSPYFTLWYLLALFCWRVVIGLFNNDKLLLPLSLIGSLLIGFLPDIGDTFSIYRVVSFFPFFVLGHSFHRERFDNMCELKISKLISVLFVGGLFFFVYTHADLFDIPVLNCQASYEDLGLGSSGWIQRLFFFAISTALIFFIGTLIPKKKNPFTFLGKYTMRVYLCHGIVYKFLYYGTDTLDIVDSIGDFILYLIASILLAFLLSQIPLESILNQITGFFKFLFRPLTSAKNNLIE